MISSSVMDLNTISMLMILKVLSLDICPKLHNGTSILEAV